MTTLNLRKGRDDQAPEEPQYVTGPPVEAASEPTHGPRGNRRSARRAALVAVIIAGIAVLWGAFGPHPWRAVFLTNDQVYFGKFRDWPLTSAVTLTDVYYLQVQPALQPPEAGTVVSVVKLGNEIHGPTDKMVIPKRNILFWEDLKPESAVVKAIEETRK